MANNISDRRVPPGAGIIIGILLGIMLWLSLIGVAKAQDTTPKQTFLVYVDTAGIAPVSGMPGVYMTWVFAKASPNALPSSGVLVAWDCLRKPQMVKRLAQVVYQLTTDSVGVTGAITEVDRPWQPVTDVRMAALVCAIGPTHADGENFWEPNHPDSVTPSKPKSPYSDA